MYSKSVDVYDVDEVEEDAASRNKGCDGNTFLT